MRRDCFLFSVMVLACSVVARGAVVGKAPDAKAWAESLDQSKILKLRAPTRILVMESLAKSNLKALEFNNGLCEQVSYISCENGRDFNYALKINKTPDAVNEDDLNKFSATNGLIFSDGDQVFYKGYNQAGRIVVHGVSKLSKSLDARKLLDRLMTSLGYDGVVLDFKGSYLLVGTFGARLRQADLQGLLIKNSAGTSFIQKESPKEGAALLNLVGQHGGYAVFQIGIGSDADEKVLGQKILIERRR